MVVLTEMEHHANLVPWQMLAAERGIELRFIPIDGAGRLDLSDLDRLLVGAKLVGITAMSNVLGTINPLDVIAEAAHAAGALVVADGAQSVPHLPVDVKTLDVDFLAFSGHKMLGPTGHRRAVGTRLRCSTSMPPVPGRRRDDPRCQSGAVLAGRAAGPLRGGHPADRRGGRSRRRRRLPERPRHGAGPGPRAGAHQLRDRRALASASGTGCTIFGPPAGPDRGGVLSLALDDVHAHDVAQVLDQFGVCVRPGHHCAKPLMRRLGVPATARASFGVFNDEHDIDVLIEGLRRSR